MEILYFYVSSSNSSCRLNFGDSDDENVGFINYNHSNDSMSFRINNSESLR